MLVLTVKRGQSIFINGEEIIVTLNEIHRGSVKIAIDAAREIPIRRQELLEKEKSNDGDQ